MDTCIICLSAPPTVTLHPCSHTHICASCATRLEHPTCPTCRQPIFKATFPDANPPSRDFKRLVQARHARDKDMHQRTMQVVVMGPRDAEGLSQRMIGGILSLFDGTPVETAFWRRHRTLPIKMMCSTDDTRDELRGLPYISKFQGNAMVDEGMVRFTWLPFPPNKQACRGWLADVKALKPDFLLLTASLQSRSSFAEMLTFDRRLRNAMGLTLPGRMWVFLAMPKSSLFSKQNSLQGAVGQNVNFNDDVAVALNSMSELHRPLTYHVLEPGSVLKGRLKKVAVRSVFHAKLRRGEVTYVK